MEHGGWPLNIIRTSRKLTGGRPEQNEGDRGREAMEGGGEGKLTRYLDRQEGSR